MAQNYVVMARKNLLKPSEAPKYYAVARSGRKVTVKEVCKRITERSSYSKGELEGCIGEFLLEIVNVLDEPIQCIKLSSLVRRSLIYYSRYVGVKRYLR